MYVISPSSDGISADFFFLNSEPNNPIVVRIYLIESAPKQPLDPECSR
tara:strand:+ start:1579 stop:1722 length:144 start_codon:yes stop_codon:yes gene_type:complete